MIKIFRGILEAATGITDEIKARFDDESLCRRCGLCCYGAVKVKSRMVLLRDLPCKHLGLDAEGKAFCGVYEVRELTGWCHRLTVESIRKELFPPDCPYMAGLPHYRGKVEISGQEFEEIMPILRNLFKIMDKPDYVRAGDWKRFINQTLDLPG